MNNYFGMDSFNRDCTEAETVYCANSVSGMRSRGIEVLPQAATVKYVDMNGLQTYHDLSQQQIKALEERIIELEKKVSATTSAFVGWRRACYNFKRLKRADLNLVFN